MDLVGKQGKLTGILMTGNLSWDCMGCYGSVWEFMGFYGIYCDLLGFIGIYWDFMGFYSHLNYFYKLTSDFCLLRISLQDIARLSMHKKYDIA